MASAVDGEIKKILMAEKEKNEYKRNKDFIIFVFMVN